MYFYFLKNIAVYIKLPFFFSHYFVEKVLYI